MNIKQANSNVLESLIPLFQREEIIQSISSKI